MISWGQGTRVGLDNRGLARSGASAARGEGVCPIGGFGGDPEPLHCRNAGAVDCEGG